MPEDPLSHDPRAFAGNLITRLTDEFGNIIISGENDGDITGEALTEFIIYRIWNGSFSLGPPEGTGVEIDGNNEQRRMPYLNGPTQVSGQSIWWTWEADANAPSGYVLRAHVPAGAAGDDSYFEQIIYIGGSRAQIMGDAVRIAVYRQTATSNGFQPYCTVRYLDASGGVLGSDVTNTIAFTADSQLKFAFAISTVSAVVVSTARFLRVRLGIKRNTAGVSDTGTFDFSDVRRDSAGGYVLLGDVSSPSTRKPGLVYQADGTVVIHGDAGGTFIVGSSDVQINGGIVMDESAPTGGGDHEIYADATTHRLVGVDTVNGTTMDIETAGQVPYALPIGIGIDAVLTSSISLIAVSGGLAGAVAVPILVPAAITVYQLRIWGTDTAANLRTAQWSVYVDEHDGTNTLRRVVQGNGFSFTPAGAAAGRSDTPTTNPWLAPGIYWLVIRNTSASFTFGIGRVARGTMTVGNVVRTNNATGVAGLGATLDISAWNAGGEVILCRLEGQIGNEAAAF